MVSSSLLQDLDVVKFIIHALSNYFPGLLAYILLFEMPFLLSGKLSQYHKKFENQRIEYRLHTVMYNFVAAVWKVIRSWLTEEQKNILKLVKKADMPQYVAADQLEEHMVKK